MAEFGGLPAREKKFLESIYPVSRETLQRLQRYREVLIQWQAKTNLVAKDTLEGFWTRHIADSLQILAIAPRAQKWIDLGSGGGFPGLVIAIANNDRLGPSYHLVESNRKKCAFLRLAAMRCEAQITIHNQRIETLTLEHRFDAVTARALAPLPKLLAFVGRFMGEGGAAYLHKGRDYAQEVEDSRGLFQFDLVVHDSRIAADSVILEITNLSKRPG